MIGVAIRTSKRKPSRSATRGPGTKRTRKVRIGRRPHYKQTPRTPLPVFAVLPDALPTIWDPGWHAALQRRHRDGDQEAAAILMQVGVQGAPVFRRSPWDEDEYAHVTVKLLEAVNQWDPTRSSWITFLRCRVGWWTYDYRKKIEKRQSREVLRAGPHRQY